MNTYPSAVLDKFRAAYSASQAALIPFKGGYESSDGILYRFKEDNPDRLVKVMFLGKAQSREALLRFESRLKFVDFLQRKGVRVIEPLLSLNDELYETVEDENGTWVAYAMRRINGKTMSPTVWDPNSVQKWGQLIGKLHRVTQDYPDWEYCSDPVTSERYLTWQSEWENFHNLCKEWDIREKWEQIGEELKALPINRNAFGFIHNDPHLWNLLVDGDNVTLLDFDVANHHWFVNDIAIACQHLLSMVSGGLDQPIHHRERLVDFLREFLKSYYRENDLSQEWLDHLDLFYAYRRILLYLVMEGWRKSKPALQESWKNMILTRPEILGKVDFHR